jgi:hypothetical protein
VGLLLPKQGVSESGELFPGVRAPQGVPDNGQGGGRSGGGRCGVREPRQSVSFAGNYAKAIEYHTQDLAIAKVVGDRAGEGRVYGNLGCAYGLQGDLIKTIEYHTQ